MFHTYNIHREFYFYSVLSLVFCSSIGFAFRSMLTMINFIIIISSANNQVAMISTAPRWLY